MHVLSDREFQIGLTMSGAISAGAYTAGVLDFLIEALDAWEDARNGPDGDAVPNHRVGVKVMSGASAGAITCAIAAIALAEAEDGSGRRRAPGAHVKGDFTYRYHVPKLYETWVVKPAFVADAPGETDFLSLGDLGDAPDDVGDFTRTSDVPRPAAAKPRVASALNSRLLDEIAASALRVKAVMNPPRAYLSSNLHVYLTLSNLRGVPYRVPFVGGDYHMISHADRVHYAIAGVGAWVTKSAFADDDKQRRLSASSLPANDPKWKDYAICALASSAFPIGLSPRLVGATLGPPGNPQNDEYGDRKFPNPNLIDATAIVPDWRPPEAGSLTYAFASADGGVIDNDPFEYAHFSLKEEGKLRDPIPADQRAVDRAVIMISPFPEAKPILAEGRPELDIFSIAKALFPALIDQARFKPDQLALALDETHGSRYLIGPRRSSDADPSRQARYTIASGLLSGFGGFVARSFRDFDFQLGRLNCRRFLASSFAVPGANEIVSHWAATVKREDFLAPKNDPGDPNETPTYRLVPLLGSAAAPIELPEWPRISAAEFETLMTRIAERFDAVAPLLIEQNVSGWLGAVFRIALHRPVKAIPGLIRDKALHFARLYILADLVRRDQIEGWKLPVFAGISAEDMRLALAELLNPKYDLRNVAGIFAAIRSVAAPDLTKDALAAALVQLKSAKGEPFEVSEADWKDQTPDGAPVALYTLTSRKSWWEIGIVGGLVDELFRPAVDPPAI